MSLQHLGYDALHLRHIYEARTAAVEKLNEIINER